MPAKADTAWSNREIQFQTPTHTHKWKQQKTRVFTKFVSKKSLERFCSTYLIIIIANMKKKAKHTHSHIAAVKLSAKFNCSCGTPFYVLKRSIKQTMHTFKLYKYVL